MNFKKGYFKVMKDGKVIDVLDEVFYIKYQPKHGVPVICDENEAQGIISSDKDTIWHEETMYRMPVNKYDTVRLEKIDEYEYKQLKTLNGKTPEEIIDNFILELLEGGLL